MGRIEAVHKPQPARHAQRPVATTPRGTKDAVSFQKVLGGQLRFSRHASQRLARRDIPFGAEELAKLENAVERAQRKGARESLVLLDDLALIVSIKNRVVITAINAENRQEGIFTNIDSVILM